MLQPNKTKNNVVVTASSLVGKQIEVEITSYFVFFFLIWVNVYFTDSENSQVSLSGAVEVKPSTKTSTLSLAFLEPPQIFSAAKPKTKQKAQRELKKRTRNADGSQRAVYECLD